MASLKENLRGWIISRDGEPVYLSEIELACKDWGYKLSNAERRLRELHNEIQEIYNEKGTAIIAYKKRDNKETGYSVGEPNKGSGGVEVRAVREGRDDELGAHRSEGVHLEHSLGI